jgi:hypothetical protein
MATFDSKLLVDKLTDILVKLGLSWELFKNAMTDWTFGQKNLSFWVEKHCIVRNRATNDFHVDFNDFVKLFKCIVFVENADRFICYFIHQFFVFGETRSDCWIRAKVNKYNNRPLKTRELNEFKDISYLEGKIDEYGRTTLVKPNDLYTRLKSLPYHKFTNVCHIWDHDPNDSSAFSVAMPFHYEYTGFVSEDELPDLLIYYLKTVLCNGSEESWIWLRSYLANIIHQPDSRTETMLVLYSQGKRLGKSTLKFIMDQILGNETNVGKVESISDVFGDRGGYATVGKRLVWFEELTDKKAVFRACMDRMKTCITDKTTTYKPLYKELHESNNTNEYIACTNNLVGVLQDRQTFLHVSDCRKDDHEFYSKLRGNMDKRGCNLFASYLKEYTTKLPMRIHKTELYHSLLTNSEESINEFIKSVRSQEIEVLTNEHPKFKYYTKRDLYNVAYMRWCESNTEKVMPFDQFQSKFSHYANLGQDGCGYKQIRLKDDRMRVFVLPKDWHTEE